MEFDEDFGENHWFTTVDEEKQSLLARESAISLSDYSSDDNLDQANSSSAWPQSYRQSVDMLTGVTPPSVSFLMGNGLGRKESSLFSSLYRRRKGSGVDSFLTKPFFSETSFDKDQVPTSNLKSSISELPSARKKCSFSQSVLNGINVLCGIGLLSTPYATKEGGWWSLLLLVAFAMIACYTGILMKRCLDSSHGLRTYPDIGQAAFGLPGRLVISILLYIELYATCVEFVIMMSDNLSRLFPNTYLSAGGIVLDPHQIFAILTTMLVLPTVWLRDLSLISYLSVGGILSSILMVLCLLWIGVVDQVGFHPTGKPFDLANLSIAIGIHGFGFAGHSVFPNIYSSMKEPSKFPLVLVASFLFCFVMYSGVAICGYLMFGDAVQSQFTLNMPEQFAASKVALWTAVLTPMTKYALAITPVALSLEELLPSKKLNESYCLSILIRTLLVISTLVVALSVPFFAVVMVLIGSFLAMLTAFIFPCACYLTILKSKVTKFEVSISILIILMAVVSGCCGTYSAIAQLAGQSD